MYSNSYLYLYVYLNLLFFSASSYNQRHLHPCLHPCPHPYLHTLIYAVNSAVFICFVHYLFVVVDLKIALYLPIFIDIVLQINVLHLCLLCQLIDLIHLIHCIIIIIIIIIMSLSIVIIVILLSTSFCSSFYPSFISLFSCLKSYCCCHLVVVVVTVTVNSIRLLIIIIILCPWPHLWFYLFCSFLFSLLSFSFRDRSDWFCELNWEDSQSETPPVVTNSCGYCLNTVLLYLGDHLRVFY